MANRGYNVWIQSHTTVKGGYSKYWARVMRWAWFHFEQDARHFALKTFTSNPTWRVSVVAVGKEPSVLTGPVEHYPIRIQEEKQ